MVPVILLFYTYLFFLSFCVFLFWYARPRTSRVRVFSLNTARVNAHSTVRGFKDFFFVPRKLFVFYENIPATIEDIIRQKNLSTRVRTLLPYAISTESAPTSVAKLTRNQTYTRARRFPESLVDKRLRTRKERLCPGELNLN